MIEFTCCGWDQMSPEVKRAVAQAVKCAHDHFSTGEAPCGEPDGFGRGSEVTALITGERSDPGTPSVAGPTEETA